MDFSAFAGLFDPGGAVATLVTAFFAGLLAGAVAVVLMAVAWGGR